MIRRLTSKQELWIVRVLFAASLAGSVAATVAVSRVQQLAPPESEKILERHLDEAASRERRALIKSLQTNEELIRLVQHERIAALRRSAYSNLMHCLSLACIFGYLLWRVPSIVDARSRH